MAQVELILASPENQEKTFSWFLEPEGHSLAQRWLTALEEDLKAPHQLERRFSFLGLLNQERDLTWLEQKIKASLEGLRTHQQKQNWARELAIPDPALLVGEELTNQAHFVFESLVGTTHQSSVHFQSASPEIRTQIGELNYLIHETEAQVRSLESLKTNGKYWPVMLTDLVCEDQERARRPLCDEDYQHFSFPHEFGHVRLHYVQLGKTPFDVFQDQDPHVTEDNIQGQHYFSGSFDLVIGPDSNPEHFQEHRFRPFLQWLQARGQNPIQGKYYVDSRGVKHGLGYLKVATTPLDQFQGRTVEQIQNLVAEHRYLLGIRLHLGDRVHECFYDRDGHPL